MSRSESQLVYKGYWKDDQPHGEGIYYFRNGDSYHGMHDDGDYHGEGKFMCHDGSIYHGEWKRGKRCGKGSFFDPETGVLTVGVWKDDVFEEYLAHKAVGTPEDPHAVQSPLPVGFCWYSRQGTVRPHNHNHEEECSHGDCDEACDKGKTAADGNLATHAHDCAKHEAHPHGCAHGHPIDGLPAHLKEHDHLHQVAANKESHHSDTTPENPQPQHVCPETSRPGKASPSSE